MASHNFVAREQTGISATCASY